MVTKWNIALDDQHGPQNGGCSNCNGLVTISPATGAVTLNYDYYALGHASKFVLPNARRIASNTFGSGSIEDVAFRNPDGSKVVVVLNADTTSRSVKVRRGRESFTYQLAAGSVATFTWGDTPPATSLTAPQDGAAFTGPASIGLTASASSSAGIKQVEFYVDSTRLGTDMTTPYGITWSNVGAGSYTLTAHAVDAAGEVAVSDPVHVTVAAPPPNAAPTVALTSPADGTTFTRSAAIVISATAGDSDGVIAKVEFYAGTTRLGTDTTAPYTMTWSTASPGTYSVTAVATDDRGAQTRSGAALVTVKNKK
jgi:hypothetical protein